MHLVETYAMSCGLQIDKPTIYETYAPLPRSCEKYISLQPWGQAPARQYKYWEEVADILRPYLDKAGIGVVQLGSSQEPKVRGTVDMRGRTTVNQAAYIIKNSMLHLGIDSFGIHMASGYGKKIVGLYSNMLPEESGPYWSKKEDVILISSLKEGELASYAHEENPQTIDRILPEKIAESVCSLLDIEFDYQYKTVFLGGEYLMRRVEMMPTHVISNWKILEVDSLIVRMDKFYNAAILSEQLKICPCSIITDKPIDLPLVQRFRSKITEFIYFIDKDTDIAYIDQLRTTGVKLYLLTKLEEEELNELKLNYVEIAPIIPKRGLKKEDVEKALKGKDPKDLYYRSSCSIIRNQKIYKNYVDVDESKSVASVRSTPPAPVVDNEEFWEDLDRMIILEKTS